MSTEKNHDDSCARVRFGDVVQMYSEHCHDPEAEGIERYVGIEHIEPEDLRIRNWGLVEEGTSFTRRFKPGQVLFVKRRAYQRKVAVADFGGLCSGDIYVLEPKDDRLLPELLPFICQTDTFFAHAVNTSAGSLSPRTNWKHLSQYEFALPPLEEQRRIVGILLALTRNKEAYVHLAEKGYQAAQAFADSVFDLGTTRTFLLRKSSAKSLQLIRLGKICSIQVGYPFKSSQYAESGDRLLRCSNVGVDKTDWSPDRTEYWPSQQRQEYQEYVLRLHDIVIAMDRPFVGDGFKVAEISSEDLPALLLQRVGRFVLSSEIDASFLWCFLHSSSFMLQLLSQQKGTDLPHISKFDIEGAVIPRMSMAQQREIGQKYRHLVDAIQKTDMRLALLKDVRERFLGKVMET